LTTEKNKKTFIYIYFLNISDNFVKKGHVRALVEKSLSTTTFDLLTASFELSKFLIIPLVPYTPTKRKKKKRKKETI